MLICKDLGGSHQGNLPACLHHRVRRGGGTGGFTAAHVSAKQTAHRRLARKILLHVFDRALLRSREGEGKRLQEGSKINVFYTVFGQKLFFF